MSGGDDGCGSPGVCYPCCKRSWNQLDDCNPSQDWQTLASPVATARNIPYLQTPHNLRQVFAMSSSPRTSWSIDPAQVDIKPTQIIVIAEVVALNMRHESSSANTGYGGLDVTIPISWVPKHSKSD